MKAPVTLPRLDVDNMGTTISRLYPICDCRNQKPTMRKLCRNCGGAVPTKAELKQLNKTGY